MVTPQDTRDPIRRALLTNQRLDSRKFLRGLVTSPKLAVRALFSARLSRMQFTAVIALLAGECVSFASCTQLLTRGTVSTGCALIGSFFVFLLFAAVATLFNSRKWQAAIVWEAIVQLPAALIAATCSIVLFGFTVGQSVILAIHPYISGGVGIACTLWIIAWRAWGREVHHVYTGSLLDVILPVVKLAVDVGTLAAAAAILMFLHFTI
jgi:hypothetical protein